MGVNVKLYLLAPEGDVDEPKGLFERGGYHCEILSSAQQLPIHDQRNGLLTAICFSADALLECHHPAIVPILFSQQPLDVTLMLLALSNGAVDCWSAQMSSSELAERGEALVARLQRTHAVSHEVAQNAKAAARLSDLEQELQDDQRAGQQIQLGMLPSQHKQMDEFLFSRWVQPSLMLSGDFVDYFPLQDRYLACFLADVAGHGASSALLTVMLKNISWRLQQKVQVTLQASWINDMLIGQGIEKHVPRSRHHRYRPVFPSSISKWRCDCTDMLGWINDMLIGQGLAPTDF